MGKLPADQHILAGDRGAQLHMRLHPDQAAYILRGIQLVGKHQGETGIGPRGACYDLIEGKRAGRLQGKLPYKGLGELQSSLIRYQA